MKTKIGWKVRSPNALRKEPQVQEVELGRLLAASLRRSPFLGRNSEYANASECVIGTAYYGYKETPDSSLSLPNRLVRAFSFGDSRPDSAGKRIR